MLKPHILKVVNGCKALLGIYFIRGLSLSVQCFDGFYAFVGFQYRFNKCFFFLFVCVCVCPTLGLNLLQNKGLASLLNLGGKRIEKKK